MPRKEVTTVSSSAQAQQEAVADGIENYELPKALVTRIAKSALPENAKLQKDTVLALVKGSTVFINYLAATAHDIAHSRQHKNISAADVLKALEIIEFGDLVGMLQGELHVYREAVKAEKSKKSASKGKARDTGEGASASTSVPRPTAASSKAKGKDKTSSEAPREDALPSVSQAYELDEDQEEELVQPNEGLDDDELAEDYAGDNDGMEEDVEDEDEDEEQLDEDLEDRMAIEEDEIRLDAKGLDVGGHDGGLETDD